MNPVVHPKSNMSFAGVSQKHHSTKSKNPNPPDINPPVDKSSERHRREPPPPPPPRDYDVPWRSATQPLSQIPANPNDLSSPLDLIPSRDALMHHDSPILRELPPESVSHSKETTHFHELEEARQRAAQMEKTMRWWSDCTTNWREKWSRVRDERNKAREECRQLRTQLETAYRECSALKKDRRRGIDQIASLQTQLDSLIQVQNIDKSKEQNNVLTENQESFSNFTESSNHNHIEDLIMLNEPEVDSTPSLQATNDRRGKMPKDSDFVTKLLQSKLSTNEKNCTSTDLSDSQSLSSRSGCDNSHQSNPNKLVNESQDISSDVQREKNQLSHSLNLLQKEYESMKHKYDELKLNKVSSTEPLNSSIDGRLSDVGGLISDLDDDDEHSKFVMEERIASLRVQLENLQAENAREWTLREQLETEKLVLERENKNLRTEISNLQEEIENKNQTAANLADIDMKNMQQTISEKSKELHDLKHVYSKMKKVLADRTTELDHSKRRAEQYEIDVRKLRMRIEELKQELTRVEDDCDQQSNKVRKLQRNNEELVTQVENLTLQVDHLQNRLKRSSTLIETVKCLDESTEGPTDDEM